MTLKEYRQARGLTQPQMAQELEAICEGIDAPLISKMEKGVCQPSEVVQAWLDAQDKKDESVASEFSEVQVLIYDKLLFFRSVTRQELSMFTGLPDRQVRKAIEGMRRCGLRIISDKSGYRLMTSEADYKNFRARELKRAKSILYTISAMDKYTEGQVGISG